MMSQRNASVAVSAAPRPNLQNPNLIGAKGMSLIAKRRHARNSEPLPLFVWAERNALNVFDPLLITRKLAKRSNLSPSVLNAMAEAHGFKGRSSHD
jgi:hypothetical protein